MQWFILSQIGNKLLKKMGKKGKKKNDHGVLQDPLFGTMTVTL
jgi:hypothetical protein